MYADMYRPGTEDVLVQRALTALALSPQARETLLQSVQMEDLPLKTLHVVFKHSNLTLFMHIWSQQ